MKGYLNQIGTFLIGIFIGVLITGSYFSHDYTMSTKPESTVYIYYSNESNEVAENEIPTDEFYRTFTEEEIDLLEQIAMAEAENQGTKGKALVMCVVLNRAEQTGQSIKDVIYKPHAFYTEGMKAGDDECHEAIAMICDGWDESEGALYFCSTGWNRYGDEHLFKYNGHWFSK